MEPIIRRRLVFSGRVQGVGFRWRARLAAEAVGATGWVRNDAGGSVSMELQGSEAQLDRVLQQLSSARFIRIDEVQTRTIPADPGERGFVTLDDEYYY